MSPLLHVGKLSRPYKKYYFKYFSAYPQTRTDHLFVKLISLLITSTKRVQIMAAVSSKRLWLLCWQIVHLGQTKIYSYAENNVNKTNKHSFRRSRPSVNGKNIILVMFD